MNTPAAGDTTQPTRAKKQKKIFIKSNYNDEDE